MAIIKQISNRAQPIQTVDTSEDFFNIDKTPLSIDELRDAFEDLIIRFDNDPNYYTKKDYYYLLKYLGEIIRLLKNGKDNNEEFQLVLAGINQKLDILQSQDEEFKIDLADLTRDLKFLTSHVNNLSTAIGLELNSKLDKSDAALTTSDKTIVGAINELDAWKATAGSNILSLQTNVDTVNITTERHAEEIGLLWDAIDNLPQGGSAPTYKEGSGIDIDENNIISAVTDQEIKATVAIGGYKAGDKIEVGTDITSVLKKLMTTVIGVVPVMPRLVIESLTFSKEYGTALPNHSYTINLIPGYFKSEDSSKWDSTQLMDCRINWLDIDQQQTNIVNAEGTKAQVSIPSFLLINSRIIDGDDVNYEISANTEFPKNNIGETLNIQGYTGGSVEISGQITYSPYYNAFIGGIDVEGISDLTSSNIRGVTPYQLNVTPTTKTLLSGQATSNNAKKAILIACPSVYKLISVQSELGTDMTDSFDVQGTVNVQCGEQSVPYNCYLCVVYGECKFQTVKLGKA